MTTKWERPRKRRAGRQFWLFNGLLFGGLATFAVVLGWMIERNSPERLGVVLWLGVVVCVLAALILLVPPVLLLPQRIRARRLALANGELGWVLPLNTWDLSALDALGAHSDGPARFQAIIVAGPLGLQVWAAHGPVARLGSLSWADVSRIDMGTRWAHSPWTPRARRLSSDEATLDEKSPRAVSHQVLIFNRPDGSELAFSAFSPNWLSYGPASTSQLGALQARLEDLRSGESESLRAGR